MASVDSFIAGGNLNQAIKCAEKVLGRSQLNSDASRQPSIGQARTASAKQISTINSIMDTSILSLAQESSLLALTGLEDKTFSLLWRGSRDGFEVKTFHQLCDDKGKTLTIIKNTEGFIFGGFTSVAWSSPSKPGFKTDNAAFLFSLTNPSGTPMKLKVTKPEGAVYSSSNCGSAFGTGLDLCVSDSSNANRNSYMFLESFELPKGIRGEEGGQLLTGSSERYFQTVEIEVFKVL